MTFCIFNRPTNLPTKNQANHGSGIFSCLNRPHGIGHGIFLAATLERYCIPHGSFPSSRSVPGGVSESQPWSGNDENRNR